MGMTTISSFKTTVSLFTFHFFALVVADLSAYNSGDNLYGHTVFSSSFKVIGSSLTSN